MTENLKQRGLALAHQGVIIGLMTVVLPAPLLLSTGRAHAGIARVGRETHVNVTFVPGNDFSRLPPQIVALHDGGFVVIWAGTGDFLEAPAIARHFDATGKAVGGEFQLEGVVGRRVTAQHDDGLVVAYVGESSVMLADFSPDGIQRSVQSIPGAGELALTRTLQNEYILVSDDEFVGQRFDTELRPTGPSFFVTFFDEPDNGLPKVPAIASDPKGGFVAVWWAEFSSAIWGRRFDAQNMPLGKMFSVVEPPDTLAHPVEGLRICVDESGDFVVTWEDYDHPAEFRRFDPQGRALTPRLTADVIDARLTCLPAQRFVAAGGTPLGVVLRVFDAQNNPFGQVVIPGAGKPAVTMLAGDNLGVAWERCYAGGAPGCDVFVQALSLTTSEDCSGDCNGDAVVTIDEIVRGLFLALNNYSDPAIRCQDITDCPAIDTDLDCQVSVTELVAAVHRSLEGCH